MPVAAAWIALAAAVAPANAGHVAAVDTAVAACERWLLNPAGWADDIGGFGRTEGLLPEATVPDIALPPATLRVGLHHWRVPIGAGGIYVTTSDRLPMCHLAGGAPFDLQPAIVALLQSPGWKARWRQSATTRRGEMASSQFVSLQEPALTMTLSHAATPGGRTDRVQLIVTAQYQPGK